MTDRGGYDRIPLFHMFMALGISSDCGSDNLKQSRRSLAREATNTIFGLSALMGLISFSNAISMFQKLLFQ